MRRLLLPPALLLLAACQQPALRPVPGPTPAPAQAAKPGFPPLLPPAQPGGLPRDPRDQGALLLGPATREQILAHRAVFRDNTAKLQLAEAWTSKWKAFDTPVVIVAAFGSWCGDTQREMPDLLALDALGNPFIAVHYFGVYRDKTAQAADWPAGIAPQPVSHVPTFWLYARQPGGGMKLIDAIVENPPKKGQPMAEAIVEMLDKAR